MTGTVLAIDPGQASGFALFQDATLVNCGVIYSDAALEALIFSLPRDAIVVCEDFTIRIATDAKAVLMLMGVLRYLCNVRLATPIVWQTNQSRRAFLSNARELLHDYDPTYPWQSHHYDAVSHALRYLYGHKARAS